MENDEEDLNTNRPEIKENAMEGFMPEDGVSEDQRKKEPGIRRSLTFYRSTKIKDVEDRISYLKKELKEISTFDYSTYSGNIMAIATCLAYSLCQIDIQETKPDQDEGLNPEPRDVLVTEFLGTQLLVELVQPQYERSEAQRELEALVTEAGGVYLVVYDFADFFHQFGDAFTNHGTSSST